MLRALIVVCLVCAGCRSDSKPGNRRTLVGWRPIASFSGRGNSQTESFNIESGQWRIKWATSNEQAAGAGTFLATVHSEVSGRPLGVPIDYRGTGHGTAYVNEDPRLYRLEIESSNEDWSVAVEESVVGYAPSTR